MLSGVALLINGLGLLGRVRVRDTAIFNVLIGSLQLVLAVLIAVSADGDAQTLLDVSSVFLFGITYFYVGLSSLLDLGPFGIGWYCGFVAFLGIFYAAYNFPTDPLLAVLWSGWTILWALFFLVLAFEKKGLVVFTAWTAILMSQLTATIPAMLDLSMGWPTGGLWAVLAGGIIAVIFVISSLLSKGGHGVVPMAGAGPAGRGGGPGLGEPDAAAEGR
jgi:hypothetical protein